MGNEKVYISGPMTGYPEYNYPAFKIAESKLNLSQVWGFIYNPANYKYDGPLDEFPIREAFAEYTKFISLEADAIYMLEGWEKSVGARAEHALALAVGIEILYQ